MIPDAPNNPTRPRPWYLPARATLLVIGYAVIQFMTVRWTSPANPRWRMGVDLGWDGWYDQTSYRVLAEQLARGQIETVNHGPGYSLLFVPFVWLMPADPFLPPMLLLYAATLVLLFWIARWFLSTEVSLLAVFLLSNALFLPRLFVEAWNNTAVLFSMLLLVYLTRANPQQRYWIAAVVGVLMSWTLSARYGDVLLLLPLALLVLYNLGANWRERFGVAVVAGVATLPLLWFTGYVQAVAFGSPLTTPYHDVPSPMFGSSVASLASRSWSFAGYHLFSMFVNPLVLNQDAMFEPENVSFLLLWVGLLASGVGLMAMARTHRALVLAFVASLLLALLYYGTYEFTSPDDLKYRALRFFAPWYPLLGLAGIVGAIDLLHADLGMPRVRWQLAGGLAVPVLLALVLYGYAQVAHPTPDPQRDLPRFAWKASIAVPDLTVPLEPAFLSDRLVYTAVELPPYTPAGTQITISMDRFNYVEQVLLLQDVTQPFADLGVQVEVSQDGACWYPAAQQQAHSDGQHVQAVAFAPELARYVRITLNAPVPATGAEIGEIHLYGKPAGTDVIRVFFDEGWYACEPDQPRPLRWMRSPAPLYVETEQSQQVRLLFRVHDSVYPNSTLTLRLNRDVLLETQVSPHRTLQVGPFELQPGSVYLTFEVQEPARSAAMLGNARDQRPLHLQIEDLRIEPFSAP